MRSAAEPNTAATGRSSDLLDRVDYRLAQTPEEKEEIYKLRYRAYLREGAILPSESGRVTDEYDDLANSFIFGIYIGGELCSSIRISILTPQRRESLSAGMFPDLIGPELDEQAVLNTALAIEERAGFTARPVKWW